MCKWGTDRKVRVAKADGKVRVDKCLARLVKVLNEYGIETITCCCGHGPSRTSSVRIDPKNIDLVPMGDALTIHLKFPYPGRHKND